MSSFLQKEAPISEPYSCPEWQKSELDKRYKDYKNGKLKLHDWEGVHEELRNKYK